MDKEAVEILKQINNSLVGINAKLLNENEFKSEADKFSDKNEEDYRRIIEMTFDGAFKINDKLFNFNNILIGAFLVLGTFPDKKPFLEIWTIIFPVFNLVVMVLVDMMCMKTFRFISNKTNWNDKGMEGYYRKINRQMIPSFISYFLTIGCLIYLIYCVVI